MEQKPCIPLHCFPAISTRDDPPAHYTLKIKSFSQLIQMLADSERENYKSTIFEASGYKWRLSLYPNGHKERGGEGHISLYVVMAETDSLPSGWEVKVNLKLFLLDQVHDNYSIFQDNDGKLRRFHEFKQESGFTKLLPLSIFKDPSNGFLICDKCVFGVEVSVYSYSGRGESIASLSDVNGTHTWRIENFSSLKNEFHYSEGFTLGFRSWKLLIFPRGEDSSKDESLSLYLNQNEEGQVFVHFVLRIRDQLHGKHKEKTGKCWCTYEWGWSHFLSLKDLKNASMGFLVKDTLIVEVEIISVSGVDEFC